MKLVHGVAGNRRHDAFAAARRPSVPNRLPEICSPGVPSRIPEMPNSPGLQHKGRRVRTQRRPAVHHERAQLKAEFHAAVQALRLLDQTENGAGSKQSNSPQRAPVFGPIKPARRDTSSQWCAREPLKLRTTPTRSLGLDARSQVAPVHSLRFQSRDSYTMQMLCIK
eukprot:6214194-Pleurochrysis_carterae.AAC.2